MSLSCLLSTESHLSCVYCVPHSCAYCFHLVWCLLYLLVQSCLVTIFIPSCLVFTICHVSGVYCIRLVLYLMLPCDYCLVLCPHCLPCPTCLLSSPPPSTVCHSKTFPPLLWCMMYHLPGPPRPYLHLLAILLMSLPVVTTPPPPCVTVKHFLPYSGA